MSESRTIRVPSKWVLAGEHSVLRGCPAIVFPNGHYSVTVDLAGEGLLDDLRVEPAESRDLVITLLKKLREFARESGVETLIPPSLIRLSSSVPIGAGLGSSAAFSVALVRVLCGDALALETLRMLARRIEDHFHGESSGMDIIAVTSAGPTLYLRGERPESLALPERFRFELHDTGIRASTRECVRQVQAHPDLGRLDQRMREATQVALAGLAGPGDAARIRQSMEISLGVYREWGLVPVEIENKILELSKAGHSAFRLTGAGSGGFLVSFREQD